jgi:hypothetical protein
MAEEEEVEFTFDLSNVDNDESTKSIPEQQPIKHQNSLWKQKLVEMKEMREALESMDVKNNESTLLLPGGDSLNMTMSHMSS